MFEISNLLWLLIIVLISIMIFAFYNYLNKNSKLQVCRNQLNFINTQYLQLQSDHQSQCERLNAAQVEFFYFNNLNIN